jgi:hypothetical protein
MSSGDPFASFKELLDKNHQFPTQYHHKFIGKNSQLFLQAVKDFETKHIGLKRVGEKFSANNEHISLSYDYQAASADDVIELIKETQKINDLIFII